MTKVALVGYTNAGKSTVMNALLNYSSTGSAGAAGASSNGSASPASGRGTGSASGRGTGSADSRNSFDTVRENTKQVFEADMLFATLDTSVRRIDAPGHIPFLLSDTVGFVSELPHALVKAFRSTLDEVRYADLLLEVVDFSDPDYREQIEVTAKTLEEIGAGNIPIVYLYNKTDLAMAAEAGLSLSVSGTEVLSRNDMTGTDQGQKAVRGEAVRGDFPTAKSRPIPVKIPFRRGDILYLAAGKGIGIPDILSLIDSAMEEDRIECRFLVPYTKGGLLQEMRRLGVLLSEEYLPDGTEVRVRCRRGDARRFQTMLKK